MVEKLLERERYFSTKIKEKTNLEKLFAEAAFQTALEHINLEQQKQRWYVELFKKLGPQEISKDAHEVRETYNTAAKRFNDSVKQKYEKTIKIEPKAIPILREILKLETVEKRKVEIVPLYLTPSDVRTTDEFKENLQKLLSEM